MPPDNANLDGVIVALVIAVLSSLTTLGVPAFWKWVNNRLDASNKREQADIQNDSIEEQLDNETRQLANKMAALSFDIQAKYQRLQAEYAQQSDMVRSQAAELSRLGQDLANCRDVAVVEYREQVNRLLHQLDAGTQTIERLQNEIAILEATR